MTMSQPKTYSRNVSKILFMHQHGQTQSNFFKKAIRLILNFSRNVKIVKHFNINLGMKGSTVVYKKILGFIIVTLFSQYLLCHNIVFTPFSPVLLTTK